MDERWQVSETAAENYTRFVATWFAPWAADLVERAGIRPGSSVLDIACGTGVVTRAASRLIGADGHIVGSDLNEDMLAEAGKHPLAGASVEWRQADATDLPFPSEAFDTVLCHQGLQFVSDRAAAASEMRRVLRPSGRAAVGIWGALECNPYGTALSGGLAGELPRGDRDTLIKVRRSLSVCAGVRFRIRKSCHTNAAYAAKWNTAMVWHPVPVMTNRCQTKWL